MPCFRATDSARPFCRDPGAGPGRAGGFTAVWPAYAIAATVGLFVVVVGALWVGGHVIGADPLDDTAWIVLGATLLRAATVALAPAGVQGWGRRFPAPLIEAGHWGAAAAQLAYPLAELVAKLLVLAGLLELPARGIGDMTSTGWFNLAAAWLVFGVPGALFVAAARSHRDRRGVRGSWPLIGAAVGVLALLGIGVLLG
ncbi:hypothetical protein [Pseudonocardia sp.]|uniref:hypothetical protein n=1 Tax=Pseudonocardia sp. TaxID=60912 RepID=UPI00262332F0|nr:hypothetical protein [Pseudonocardia sp.]